MNPDVLSFAQVSVIIVALVGSLSLIGVVVVRAFNRPGKRPPDIDDRGAEQLERLQQSVDAIAIEVERIAEAQRFTARLMSDRATAGRDSLPPPQG